MAIKFDFRKIPIHWRILIGGQFCVGALILAFRSRSIDASAVRVHCSNEWRASHRGARPINWTPRITSSLAAQATQQRDLARLEQAKPRGASALARAAKEEEQRARE